uniref:Transmembrane protein n=1 Tax=Glossina pallidipes TaxID=7398 RepID=A0A1A9ZXT6_GLOPL
MSGDRQNLKIDNTQNLQNLHDRQNLLLHLTQNLMSVFLFVKFSMERASVTSPHCSNLLTVMADHLVGNPGVGFIIVVKVVTIDGGCDVMIVELKEGLVVVIVVVASDVGKSLLGNGISSIGMVVVSCSEVKVAGGVSISISISVDLKPAGIADEEQQQSVVTTVVLKAPLLLLWLLLLLSFLLLTSVGCPVAVTVAVAVAVIVVAVYLIVN